MNEWKKWPIKTIEQNDFPEGLKGIRNCPKKLYYRGEWNNNLFEKTVAIVGSRQITRYGKEIIDKIMPEIVFRKTTVISGFMYGVDSESHWKCLEYGGKTVAVIGSGLNELCPKDNDKLYTKILETGGTIISEYESDFKATTWSFPQRNRIVSGLATVGVVVIEAGIKSGSLITAKLALEQKRHLLAIPGPINSRTSEGTNWLIKTGSAKMITTPVDIFEDKIIFPEQETLFKDYSNLNEVEKIIIDLLETEAMTSDELCQIMKRNITEISTNLSMMLMKDLLTEEDGKFYIS
ncbi:MAG: DNA-processing protein DprA [Candidatus Shapirobacteria bacterium]